MRGRKNDLGGSVHHPQWLMILLVAGLWLLFPAEARADGIDIGFVAVAGVVILVPLMVFEVFVEAVFLAVGLKFPYRKVLLLSLGANLASLLAGIPVKVFNAWMYANILPHRLAPYFRELPRAVFLGTALYFVVTVLVELVVVLRWRRKRSAPVSLRRATLAVLLANAATYAVLAPLHYVATRPINDIREFTDDSRWAQRPATTIYYVERGTGNLCSIATDGQARRVLVPDTVKDYQFRSERGWFLYRNGSDHLCLFQEGARPQVCWKTDQRFTMAQVACNPDGTTVAYLSRIGDLKPFELVLRQMASGRIAKTGVTTSQDDYDPEVAWSESPDVVLLRDAGHVRAYRIGKDLSTSPVRLDPATQKVLTVYGRFSHGGSWSGDGWSGTFAQDVSGENKASTEPGIGSHLWVESGGRAFVLADNPGLFHLTSRGFGDVCFLGNGKELIFDDEWDIYLLDVNRRKVGWIAHGSKFLTFTARYQRKIVDAEK
jgi:hypothetical protein